MKTYTTQELQQMLVAALPEKLGWIDVDTTSHPDNPGPVYQVVVWTNMREVTDHEWESITRLVEDGLNAIQNEAYGILLPKAVCGVEYYEVNPHEIKRVACAPWPVRAQSLVGILKIKN